MTMSKAWTSDARTNSGSRRPGIVKPSMAAQELVEQAAAAATTTE
jgi:hypothetical protein